MRTRINDSDTCTPINSEVLSPTVLTDVIVSYINISLSPLDMNRFMIATLLFGCMCRIVFHIESILFALSTHVEALITLSLQFQNASQTFIQKISKQLNISVYVVLDNI